MKDWKQLMGIAAILFGIGFVVRSFQPAYALNGPSVSMGSNPIEHHYTVCNGQNNGAILLTNNNTSDFIITDIMVTNQSFSLKIDGQDIAHLSAMEGVHNFVSGLKVISDQVLSCWGNSNITIAGYYAHTP